MHNVKSFNPHMLINSHRGCGVLLSNDIAQ